ncbi:RNA-binding domain-containing protein [Selenomonas sp.]|uniref:RNA-binding domain-containing protein n=1 Tax=Selenomonas sp. TaxID=2053611 RepID=UPI002A82BC34|nr:RNA-binding domain-containing protein [Selenomonas sp.]MDY4416098.1 putative DNA binding domain-containing protein [Selenomonas sp.]
MLAFKNETTEYKRELTEGLKKEVLAFANTAGGSIYIGVEDDGTVVGVEQPDDVMLRISGMLRDSIHPDILMFVRIRAERMEGHAVICVSVSEGTNKPYYLVKHGLKPSGVYVRRGSASVPASSEQIRRMIKETDGDVFEENLSLVQDLTFQKAKSIFEAHHMMLGPSQMQTLGLCRKDRAFTNLALMLSDQCPFSIKAAVFQGTDQSLFQDRREFMGSLFSQMEDCYAFLQLNNPLGATFRGLYRKDEKAYPDEAVREALLNCIVHRDYFFHASTIISIYSNRMEFVSIGSLLPGVQKEDVLLGLSVCRNKRLAQIFYRLELIEAFGTGLLKIRNAYQKSAAKPELFVTQNAFKLVLPKMTEAAGRLEAVVVREASLEETPKTSKEEAAILALAGKRTDITRKDVEGLLQVSSATATRVLRAMVERGSLLRFGKGKGTRYRRND